MSDDANPPPPPPPPPGSADDGHAAGAHGNPALNHVRTALAFLIALISITGALVTWRAEVSGSEAGKADREGTIVAVNAESARQQAVAQARAEARAAQRSYEAWSASQLYDKEMKSASGAAYIDALKHYRQENALAIKLTDGYFVLDFTTHDNDGYVTAPGYDIEGRVGDLLAQQSEGNESPERFFAEATDLENRESHLYELDVALVVALALVAVGQLAATRRRALSWAAPGALIYVAATALFIAVEV